MLKPLLVFFIYSHSGYLSDSLDLEFSTPPFLNPNTATFQELVQIPFFSTKEVLMIIAERKEKPFSSTYDLAQRIGLFPFEAEYLKDILYFGKEYSLKFRFSYDSCAHYLMDYVYSGYPIASIWEKRGRTYFMNSVKTRYITIIQGYIKPLFKGDLLDNHYIPRRDGLKRDTSYNLVLTGDRVTLFYSPHSITIRGHIKNLFAAIHSDTTWFHTKSFALGIGGKHLLVEGGFKNNRPAFYVSLNRYYNRGRVFSDIYSKHDNYRTYGGHIYTRAILLKNLNLKVYGSYIHSYYTSMRFSAILQYKIPSKRSYFNLGVKKLYSSNTRVYFSTGMWGKNHMYFSIVKDIGTLSYMLRYSIGFYNLSFQYMLSSNDADYIILDSSTGAYFMGRIKERMRIGYRIRVKKNYTLKLEYENGDRTLIRTTLYGRIYH